MLKLSVNVRFDRHSHMILVEMLLLATINRNK